MGERWARAWLMVQASFVLLRRYPRLAVFPAISGLVFAIVLGLIAVDLLPHAGRLHIMMLPLGEWLGTDATREDAFYRAAFVAAYLLTAVVIFFNAALIHCALRCYAGEKPSLFEGIGAAAERLPQILVWALFAVTVRLFMALVDGILRERLSFIGALIANVLDFGWSVLTYFVVPVLVIEGTGPFAAMRRSSAILTNRWGDNPAGGTLFGMFGALFGLAATLLFLTGFAIVQAGGAGVVLAAGPLLMAAGAAIGLATLILLQALSAIYQTSLYLYATTGEVPEPLEPERLRTVFWPAENTFG